jgi:hypothetical protein
MAFELSKYLSILVNAVFKIVMFQLACAFKIFYFIFVHRGFEVLNEDLQITVNPVLLATSKKRPPVNNNWPESSQY